MPRPALFDRSRETIGTWERAAADRFVDAEVLHKRSRETAAVYLYGYSVEIRAKAAYFRAAGVGSADLITRGDRATHAGFAKALFGFPSVAGGHDIAVWAQMAVLARSTTQRPYSQALGIEVVNRAVELYAIWRETLRYADAVAAPGEVKRVRAIASWFDKNYHRLT